MFIATFTCSVCPEASGRLPREQAAAAAPDGGPKAPAPGGAGPGPLAGRQHLRAPSGPREEAPWLDVGQRVCHAAWTPGPAHDDPAMTPTQSKQRAATSHVESRQPRERMRLSGLPRTRRGRAGAPASSDRPADARGSDGGTGESGPRRPQRSGSGLSRQLPKSPRHVLPYGDPAASAKRADWAHLHPTGLQPRAQGTGGQQADGGEPWASGSSADRAGRRGPERGRGGLSPPV